MAFHIGLELSVRVVELLILLQDELDEQIHRLNSGVNWSDPTNMRLMLRDLPEVDSSLLPYIRSATSKIARQIHEFELQIANTRFLPSDELPRMIIVEASSKDEKTIKLHKMLNSGFEPFGILMEKRPFLPLVLVGRIRSGKKKPNLKPILNPFEKTNYGITRVRELVLYQSHKTGPVSILDRFALGTGK